MKKCNVGASTCKSISYAHAWSFAVLGLVLGTTGIYEIERKDASGEWPERPSKKVEEPTQAIESKSKEKPKGSWRSRSNSSEEE